MLPMRLKAKPIGPVCPTGPLRHSIRRRSCSVKGYSRIRPAFFGRALRLPRSCRMALRRRLGRRSRLGGIGSVDQRCTVKTARSFGCIQYNEGRKGTAMTIVRLASAHVKRLDRDATLPARFGRLLSQLELGARFKGKRVAIKMHVGGEIGFYTIHPLFVRILVQAVREAGGSPYLTDGAFSIDAATARGYTPEVVGCRIVGASGEHDLYVYKRQTDVPGLPEIEVCGNIVDADALIVFSHGKGHGHTGFGGAIKNIGMGCVSYRTRGWIHALMSGHFAWQGELCTHCRQCISGCPTGAIRFNDQDEIAISEHHCRFCMHCVRACPAEALSMDQPEEKFRLFQAGMAAVAKEVLGSFEAGAVTYITCLMNITPLCDCWGFSTPPLVPDIGILQSDNIVAIEQASLDMVKTENLIAQNVPDQLMPMGEAGHLFQRIHGKDPYEQIRQCVAAGLGTTDYAIEEVK